MFSAVQVNPAATGTIKAVCDQVKEAIITMNKPRIGIIGLGGIAQKVYLPILAKEDNWILAGAYTPNETKRQAVCQQYRITAFPDLESVSRHCDAVFVHSSTETHYQIVRYFLQNGKDVYVDKPLAATSEEAEQLAELSMKHKRKLMVGFNRRFAPFYIKARNEIKETAWIRMEKHRVNNIDSVSFTDTMLDDYIHVIDTARWLCGGSIQLEDGIIQTNDSENLIYTQHTFSYQSNRRIFTGMHRDAGTGLELLELTGSGRIIRVKNMDILETEENGRLTTQTPGSWQTILEEKGFTAAVRHFVNAIIDDSEPLINGEEGLKTQLLLDELIKKSKK